MNRETILNYLNRYDYKFKESDNLIIVSLDFSLQFIIDLSNPDKIKLSDKLKSANFLTWPFSMSIKNSMIFNLIAAILATILFLGLGNSYNTLTLIILFIFAMFMNLIWLIYYLVKSENFKKQIIDLTK